MDRTVAERVDARALVCPMPTIRPGQAVTRGSAGDMIEIVTGDPGSVQNKAAWCKNTGHRLVVAAATATPSHTSLALSDLVDTARKFDVRMFACTRRSR